MPRLIAARRPTACTPPARVESAEILSAYLDDASGFPRGHAAALVRPATDDEAAAAVIAARGYRQSVLPQAARTSLTGGAVPHGECVISVERLDRIGPLDESGGGDARIRVGAGVRLKTLEEYLRPRGYFYPPVPTCLEAMVGGTLSTNAGGAATFKYGVTREWVESLELVLSNGDRLSLARGQAQARPGESFRILLSDGSEFVIPVPTYRLPPLKKLSAGYHAADPLDLVDLFIGAEGTLALITGASLRLRESPAAELAGLVFCDTPQAAMALATELRQVASEARRAGDDCAPDIRAIEWFDARSLELILRAGIADKLCIALPEQARAAIYFELELPHPSDRERTLDRLAAALNGGAGDTDGPLLRLFRILRSHDLIDRTELAFPGDASRRQALAALREAVPQQVGELLAGRGGLAKCAGDMIVPFEKLGQAMELYRSAFEAAGLDYAVWGHFGDGNLHPNVLLRNESERDIAEAVLLQLAVEITALGGAPLSEHGVGRHPLKQRMLREFLGMRAIGEMRAIKRALDPSGCFAPGVLFPR